MITYKIVLGIAIFLTALISGLFYSYSVSVNPGLHRLADAEYLRAMQNINRAILNPLFYLSFMGTVIMLPVCTWMVFKQDGTSLSFWLLLAAALVYLIGTFGVTVAGNVPLNNMLDQFDTQSATVQQVQVFRINFEMPWNRLHSVRTLANAVSLLLAIAAALVR